MATWVFASTPPATPPRPTGPHLLRLRASIFERPERGRRLRLRCQMGDESRADRVLRSIGRFSVRHVAKQEVSEQRDGEGSIPICGAIDPSLLDYAGPNRRD